MTACRVSIEERNHDHNSREITQADLKRYRNEIHHLIADSDSSPVISAIRDIIADEVTEGKSYKEAVIDSIDWYLDNHLDNVVDLVEG